jgi:hypothetical protein
MKYIQNTDVSDVIGCWHLNSCNLWRECFVLVLLLLLGVVVVAVAVVAAAAVAEANALLILLTSYIPHSCRYS